MDENNAVGQTYESIMSDRFKMYEFRTKLGYARYNDLSAKIAFTIKKIRALKKEIKKCQRLGTELGISGKTVYRLGTRSFIAELNMELASLRMLIGKRKEKMEELRRLIGERNDAYNKLNNLGK